MDELFIEVVILKLLRVPDPSDNPSELNPWILGQ